MPTKNQAEDWVQALRTFLKDQLVNKNRQLVEKKTGKTALLILQSGIIDRENK